LYFGTLVKVFVFHFKRLKSVIIYDWLAEFELTYGSSTSILHANQ